MQDAIAIAVSLAAAIWLVRALTRQFFAPPCRPPSAGPAGSDGFVALETLRSSRPRDKRL
ncbi:MAG: hypothetical protein WCH77_03640 [Planctomycetota bacterium]